MNDYKDHSYSVGTGFGHIETKQTSSGVWFDGIVITPHGIAAAFSTSDYTSIAFVWKGRRFSRTWNRQYMPRTLAKLAKQFAKEIATAS